jgi:hypothetical protein
MMCKVTEFYTEKLSVCFNITSKLAQSPYLKASSKKVMIQTKLLGISVIFYCTELDLSKRNSSLVVSVEQDMNFNIQLPSRFVFCFF